MRVDDHFTASLVRGTAFQLMWPTNLRAILGVNFGTLGTKGARVRTPDPRRSRVGPGFAISLQRSCSAPPAFVQFALGPVPTLPLPGESPDPCAKDIAEAPRATTNTPIFK